MDFEDKDCAERFAKTMTKFKCNNDLWISVTDRLPADNVPVNITWVNRNPPYYYADIKDKPFTATGVHYKGKWFWYSVTVEDMLTEYGKSEFDEINNDIDVIAWMPLPEPYRERRTDEC